MKRIPNIPQPPTDWSRLHTSDTRHIFADPVRMLFIFLFTISAAATLHHADTLPQQITK